VKNTITRERLPTLKTIAFARNLPFGFMDIHEVQPVKFGGDPVDSANKTLIERPRHWEVTAWWKKLQNDVEGK
jgi:hypothetical protein